ncbi:MAG: FAD-dependent monooxygenase [Paracoccaceae bacterium]
MKILIAGAGPVGLTAGVELARRGAQVQIIDRRKGGSALSRAVGINPKSLDILTPSGVTNQLLAQGVTYRDVRMYRGAKIWARLRLTDAPIQHGHNIMLGLPQDQTETILRNTFFGLGGTISYSKELTGLHQTDDTVTASIADGSEITADYLIGADGLRSATRQALGIAYHCTPLPDIWSISDVDVDNWPHLTSATICLMPKGRLAAIVPLGGTRLRFISNTPDALHEFPLDLNVTQVHRKASFQVSLCHVDTYSKGRVFLAGDAAHSQSPAGGRGMNLGISDAADLAARLMGGDLDGYTASRLSEGTKIMAGAETMRKILTSKNPATRLAVLTGIKLVSSIPALRAKFASNFLYG